MNIQIPHRKNDQYPTGHTISIARSGKTTCPVLITQKILALLPNNANKNVPMVRRIIKSKSGEKFHDQKGVSYSTIKDQFRKYLNPFVGNVKEFSLHSLKSGAASNQGCRTLDDKLLDRHAGWRNPASKNRYIKYSTNDLLQVSVSLGL